MNYKFRIAFLYFAGVVCIVLFFVMKKSQKLGNFMEKAERTRADWSMGVFATVGMAQYGLLVTGISIITILSAVLIWKRGKSK